MAVFFNLCSFFAKLTHKLFMPLFSECSKALSFATYINDIERSFKEKN